MENKTDRDAWSEYESAAEYVAKRGRKGSIGETLPENMTPEAVQLIADDPEAFEARVKDYAYGLAMECHEKFTVCVSVGGVVQFFELTRAEIEETWRTVQSSILPQTFVGWYDEKSKWTQLGTKPAKF